MKSNKQVGCNPVSSLVFCPYFAQRYLSMIFWFASVLLMLCIIFGGITVLGKLLLGVLIVVSVILAWGMNRQSHLCVKIDTDGLTLNNTRKSFYAKWADYTIVYCFYDTKGHSYMLFATHDMDVKCRKEIIRQLFIVERTDPRLDVDGNVCFRVDNYENAVVSIVGERIPFVNVPGREHGI